MYFQFGKTCYFDRRTPLALLLYEISGLVTDKKKVLEQDMIKMEKYKNSFDSQFGSSYCFQFRERLIRQHLQQEKSRYKK